MKTPMTVSRAELMPDGTDRAFRTMVHDTLAFSARIAEIRARLGALIGLPGSAYTVLITISHLEGRDGVGVSAVAHHLHLSGAAVTIEVNRLVRLGLIDKRVNPSDRRRVLLRTTGRAVQALVSLTSAQIPANDALFACLTADDFRRFADLMSELVSCADDSLATLETRGRAAA